jgi:hypothetical protein
LQTPEDVEREKAEAAYNKENEFLWKLKDELKAVATGKLKAFLEANGAKSAGGRDDLFVPQSHKQSYLLIIDEWAFFSCFSRLLFLILFFLLPKNNPLYFALIFIHFYIQNPTSSGFIGLRSWTRV